MTPSQSNQLQPITGWLLIDCWQEDQEPKKQIIDQWIARLVQNQHFFDLECVVNACHSLSLGDNIDPDPFCKNTLDLYCHDAMNEDRDLIFNLVRESNRAYKTHHTIVQNLSTAPSAVALVDIHDFTKHCERTLEGRVRNWLVAGHDWQICLHKRNLGLNNLRDLVNHGYNFYVTKWSVLKEDGTSLNELDLRDDGLSWQTIPGFGWRLLAD